MRRDGWPRGAAKPDRSAPEAQKSKPAPPRSPRISCPAQAARRRKRRVSTRRIPAPPRRASAPNPDRLTPHSQRPHPTPGHPPPNAGRPGSPHSKKLVPTATRSSTDFPLCPYQRYRSRKFLRSVSGKFPSCHKPALQEQNPGYRYLRTPTPPPRRPQSDPCHIVSLSRLSKSPPTGENARRLAPSLPLRLRRAFSCARVALSLTAAPCRCACLGGSQRFCGTSP
jgi:hypothetical protein